MLTVPSLVEEYVAKSPYLEEGLLRNLINLSSLARVIKPELEKRLYKPISEGSIVMSLKRLSISLKSKNTGLDKILAQLTDITIRSNLVELTFDNSSTLLAKQTKLLTEISGQKNNFLTFSTGVYETSIFISANLSSKVEELFKEEKLRNKMGDLSAITIILPEEAVYVPGVYYSMLKTLAWEGINFVEVVSSFTELTIIVENSKIDKAFSVLKKLSS